MLYVKFIQMQIKSYLNVVDNCLRISDIILFTLFE